MRTSMKAVVIERPGPPEVLTLQERPVPTGNEFDVDLRHAVQPGSPGHSSRLRLRGRLVGEHLRGTSDDGTNEGEWMGTRY